MRQNASPSARGRDAVREQACEQREPHAAGAREGIVLIPVQTSEGTQSRGTVEVCTRSDQEALHHLGRVQEPVRVQALGKGQGPERAHAKTAGEK